MTEDKILLLAMSKGSVKAFDALYRKYAPKVGQFSSVLLSNGGFGKADVDDLVQEMFIKIWQKRESLASNVDNFNAYLFRMTKNAVLNILYRNKSVHEALDNTVELASQEDLLAETIAIETENAVMEALEKMPEERKVVFRMSRDEGLPHKEIARQLSISQKTVEYHIGRALTDIKKNIG